LPVNALTLTTLGVGAADSPRFAPAGLLVVARRIRVMLDGGPGAEPRGHLDAWLVSDERCELMSRLKDLARERGLQPRMAGFSRGPLQIRFRRVVHTNHVTGGYLIAAGDLRVVWAPEFWKFPAWAAAADLMFAEASGWSRPIRFAGGIGGHLGALAVAEAARLHGVRRLAFAHLGRPTLRAMDLGLRPPFGEFARDGQVFRVRASARADNKGLSPLADSAGQERS
jgi:hypothetical protein